MATKAQQEIDDFNKLSQNTERLLQKQADWYKQIGDFEKERAKQSEIISNRQQLINEMLSKTSKLSTQQKANLNDLIKLQDQELDNEKAVNAQLKQQENNRKNINAALSEGGRLIKEGWKYLMESDKVIKSTILNLGLSGVKAADMRNSFEQSAGHIARLGGSLEDVQKIMEGFADETGRARVLSSEMVGDIAEIGKGTGLGIEQATKLGAQFEFMGVNARTTKELVQGVVDTSERMGINTNKVLKNINDNFKKLNTYNFNKGSKGMADMAMNAEKTRVSITDALSVGDKARNLEGAIDMMAQLQVMGGSFAKEDPLSFMYTARNEPEKLTQKISEMTKGMVTLRKTSEGTFERFISPVDRDRLDGAAKALGMTSQELTVIAQKRADLEGIDRQIAGKGLTGREKELVEGAAVFNTKTAKYEVMLAGHMRDVSTMTSDEVKLLDQQTKSLEARAKDAQTFDDVLKVTMNELKSALLPILKAVNSVLTTIRPVIEGFTNWATKGSLGWLKVGASLMAAGVLWKGLVQPLSQNIGDKTVGKMAGYFRGGGAGATPAGGGIGGGATNAGKGMLRGGAGIGLASAGVGAMGVGMGEGVNLAATGISKLADSMSKLTDKQAETLKSIAMTLAISFPAAAVGMTLFGLASASAAIPILAVGAAMVGVGYGISLATKGIGKMAEGFATMFTAAKGVGPAFDQISTGIAKVGVAMIVNARGMGEFTSTLATIGKYADDVILVGNAFKNIGTVLSGHREDFIAIQNAVSAIAGTKVQQGSFISELANILKSPLKVEFANKEVAVVSNITMNIDGHKLFENMNFVGKSIIKQQEAKSGQGALSHK